MSVPLVQKAREQALNSIRELKRIDRRLTKLGCLNAHVHFKRRNTADGEGAPSNMMYLLEPQDRVTKKRAYTYVGIDEKKQKRASERIARHKLRERLRAKIAMLKSALRKADAQLTATLKTYRALAAKARASVTSFAKKARRR